MGMLSDLWNSATDMMDANIDRFKDPFSFEGAANILLGGGPFAINFSVQLPLSNWEVNWHYIKHALVPDMRRDRELATNSSVTPQRMIYGTTRVSGQLAYVESTGADNTELHLIYILAGHVVSGFGDIWLDDDLIGDAKFSGKVEYELFDGTQTEACAALVAASLTNAVAPATKGLWTEQHIGKGITYLYLKLIYDESVFVSGMPIPKVVVHGKKVYDPRTTLTLVSSNPVLNIRDYMLMPTNLGGGGYDSTEIDANSIIAAANICDQTITTVDGDEARYQLNGIITLDTTPSKIVSDMLTSMSGQALFSDGVWKLFAGSYTTPVKTLDESWLNGGISFQVATDKSNRSNVVKGTFIDPEDEWAEKSYPMVPEGNAPPNAVYWDLYTPTVDYVASQTYVSDVYVRSGNSAYKSITNVPINSKPPNATYWVLVEDYDTTLAYVTGNIVQRAGAVYEAKSLVPVNNPYIAEDGGEQLISTLNFPFSTSHHASQRLAQISLNKSRRGLSLSYPCNMKAFTLQPMDVVYVNNTILGWSNKTFRVSSWKFVSTGVSLTLSEDSADVWDETSTAALPVIPQTILPDPRLVNPPTGLTLTPRTYVFNSGTALRVDLDIEWINGGPSGNVKYLVQYKLTSDSTWISYPVTTETTLTINALDAADYNVRVKATNSIGAVSDWTTDTVTIPLPDNTVPNVTGFSATFANNLVTFSWTALSNSSLLYEIRQGSTWASATVIRTGESTSSWSIRPSGSGSVTYLIKAVDIVGNTSVTAASTSVTVPVASPPTAIAPTSVMFGIELVVTYPQTSDIGYCEIWAATTNNRDVSSLIGITRNGKFTHQGLGNSATRYYWARTKNVFEQNSTWYPVSSTAGVVGATISNPTTVLQLLNDDVTSQAATDYLAGTKSLIEILDTKDMLFEVSEIGAGVTGTYTEILSQVTSEMVANKLVVTALNSMVSGLITSDYNAATTYTVGQFVKVTSGDIFQCILESTGNEPPNETYWLPTSDLVTLVNTIQQNLDIATGTWESTATSLKTRVDDLAPEVYSTGKSYVVDDLVFNVADSYTYKCIAPTTGNAPPNATYWEVTTAGRVTLAESSIIQNANGIELVGQSITGPLAFVAGVFEPGVFIESVEDVVDLEVQVSKTRINLDTANADIVIQAGRIDTALGRITNAEINIDGANAAIALRASITTVNDLTNVVSTKATQIDLDAANAQILLRATEEDLAAEVQIRTDQIALKLNATGTVGPGLTIGWTDETHTKSNITMLSDTFRIAQPDGTGIRTVFSLGEVNTVPTVGIGADLIIDGAVLARHIAVDQLTVGENVTMGSNAVIQWSNLSTESQNNLIGGAVRYTWVKYADTPTTGMSDTPTGKLYIGLAANKTSSTESTDYADYTWALIKGADGVTTYTWIKYADVADGTGLYDTPNSETLYIGIAVNKTSDTESTVKTDYVWSLFKGATGDQGVPGDPGDDGVTTYTWIKYGTSAVGDGLSDDPTGKTYIGLAYNKTTAVESSTASDYAWSLIKGADGSSVEVEYSIDGSTLWHSTYTAGDFYLRQRIGTGAWSSAIKFVGTDGSTPTLVDLGGMPMNPETSTNIGSNWIYTGVLTAGQVNAVEINADNITTGTLTVRSTKSVYGRYEEGLRIVRGTFVPQGTGAPTVAAGSGFTVERIGVGVFRITCTDAFTSIPTCTAMLSRTLVKALTVYIYTISNGTLEINVVDTETNTNYDTNITVQVHFTAISVD